MTKLDKLDEYLKALGIKVMPYQREILEKALNAEKPYFIIMHKDQGRTYFTNLAKMYCEILGRKSYDETNKSFRTRG